MSFLIITILLIVLAFVVFILYKGSQDPEVKEANKLMMLVTTYRKCKEVFQEHQKMMDTYGRSSKMATDFLMSALEKNKITPNEWMRFSQYQLEKEINDSYEEILRQLRS